MFIYTFISIERVAAAPTQFNRRVPIDFRTPTMSATRLFILRSNIGSSSSSFSKCHSSHPSMWTTVKSMFPRLSSPRYHDYEGVFFEDSVSKQPPPAASRSTATTFEPPVRTNDTGVPGADQASELLANVIEAMLRSWKVVTKPRPWKLQFQMFIEKVIIDCRFFTLLAVAGSLLGSVLCFAEGSFMIIGSYFQYFSALSQRSDQAHVIHLLIEAIDMFLVGTAMLIFGMGLHVMFVGSKNLKGKISLPPSNLFGLFYLKALPPWVRRQTVTEAKTKIGHAVMMILQVGLLEKFKEIPVVTGLDLACTAAAVFVSSACIFLLSRLSTGNSASAAD